MRSTNSLFVFVALAGVAQPAFAYLDPGAGSMVLQMLIAGIMGALFTIKMYWRWFKNAVANLFRKKSDSASAADSKDNPVPK